MSSNSVISSQVMDENTFPDSTQVVETGNKIKKDDTSTIENLSFSSTSVVGYILCDFQPPKTFKFKTTDRGGTVKRFGGLKW